jgi:hypothetical protein
MLLKTRAMLRHRRGIPPAWIDRSTVLLERSRMALAQAIPELDLNSAQAHAALRILVYDVIAASCREGRFFEALESFLDEMRQPAMQN